MPLSPLTPEAARAVLKRLPGWTLAPDARSMEKTFEFETFPLAVAFVVRVAEAAEAADHHPDVDLRYRRVRIALSTHEAKGLTERDTALAPRIDAARHG